MMIKIMNMRKEKNERRVDDKESAHWKQTRLTGDSYGEAFSLGLLQSCHWEIKAGGATCLYLLAEKDGKMVVPGGWSQV